MKIFLSPAKTLDYKSKLPTTRATQPQFLEKAEMINSKMVHKSKKSIAQLMDISDKLAQLNYQRYREFATPFTKENARPAIYAFAGDVYIGFDAYSLPVEKLDLAQESIRILSGMYGILRPLDLIQPYRLEMGTDLSINRKKNLYAFWKSMLTDFINAELKEDQLLLNLASVEYFKVLNVKKIKGSVISPNFLDFKNGKLKFISFFGKKARGSMARYCIDRKIDTLEGIMGFDYDGYRFSEKYTEKETEPVFIR